MKELTFSRSQFKIMSRRWLWYFWNRKALDNCVRSLQEEIGRRDLWTMVYSLTKSTAVWFLGSSVWESHWCAVLSGQSGSTSCPSFPESRHEGKLGDLESAQKSSASLRFCVHLVMQGPQTVWTSCITDKKWLLKISVPYPLRIKVFKVTGAWNPPRSLKVFRELHPAW